MKTTLLLACAQYIEKWCRIGFQVASSGGRAEVCHGTSAILMMIIIILTYIDALLGSEETCETVNCSRSLSLSLSLSLSVHLFLILSVSRKTRHINNVHASDTHMQ
jgi:hypothetical protein